jgi:hypothetical protein
MDPISTIDELIEIFEQNTSHEYAQIMKRINISEDDLIPFAS